MFNMDCCSKKRLLMIMTSACACAAFGLLSIAVATDYWLFTMDRQKDTSNGSAYDRFWSGLWRKCKIIGESSNFITPLPFPLLPLPNPFVPNRIRPSFSHNDLNVTFFQRCHLHGDGAIVPNNCMGN